MPNLFRSEPMTLLQLMIPSDAAEESVNALGELGLLQLKDLNADMSVFQRSFTAYVKIYDEMERKISFFESCLEKHPEIELGNTPFTRKPFELKEEFEEYERDLKENLSRSNAFDRQESELKEHAHVLKMAAPFLDSVSTKKKNPVSNLRPLDDKLDAPLIGEEDEGSTEMEPVGQKEVNVGFITGVISREKMNIFERVIFRAIRGNVYIRFADVDELLIDPSTGQKQKKSVFIIFFSGSRSENKITKVCEAFNANRYTTPQDMEERQNLSDKIQRNIMETMKVAEAGYTYRAELLHRIAGSLPAWKLAVHKQKMTFHALNMFNYDNKKKVLVGEGWAPTSDCDKIISTLRMASTKAGGQANSICQPLEPKRRDTPPTFFRADKYFSAFQNIVDAYGVARYREFNPAVFTMITFPFLFAVMFGDVGHGILLTLAALWLIYKERHWKDIKLDETVAMVYNGRFLLLLMGIFSIYCGTIYNDYFALGIDFTVHSDSDAHGMWKWGPEVDGTIEAVPTGGVYPWGIDPMWKGARNMLPFLNSFKMKTSIVFGVVQMSMGVMVKLVNDVYFRNWVNVIFEWIPSILILECTFGYLVIMIFVKWAIPWSIGESAPSLITMLIGMFMSPFHVEQQFFPGQMVVQVLLLLIAGISVPMMLLPKPLILWMQAKTKAPRRPPRLHESMDGEANSVDGLMEEGQPMNHGRHVLEDDEDEEEPFEFGEVFVHQTIHTIEFVLGAISNTASYLRLWALSLAHAELSEVFWDLTIAERGASIEVASIPWYIVKPPAIFFTFALWAAITFAVLMCMESLSAFLHALRLHWVEFQGKFYAGDGVQFVPFNFNGEDYEE